MYSTKPVIVLGFHGCDKSVRDRLVLTKSEMIRSDNSYDWLGHGMYFWEGNVDRAKQWAEENKVGREIKTPSVVGAVLDLGLCFDLVDSKYLKLLKDSYNLFKSA